MAPALLRGNRAVRRESPGRSIDQLASVTLRRIVVEGLISAMKHLSKYSRSLAGEVIILLLWAGSAFAQTCYTAGEMNEASRNALESAAKRYFDMAARGDSASLKQNAIPSLADQFTGIEAAVKDNQPSLSGATPIARPPFLLKQEGGGGDSRGEFLCGVFGPSGQTANSTEFIIPNLSAGNYGLVILDVNGPNGPRTVSFVLEQQGNDWKMGGFYVKAPEVNGHDGRWFAEQARAFKAKGQNHNAWFYYLEARELLVAVPFMSTQMTDQLYDESQTVKPTDLPVDGNTIDLATGGKTYRLTSMFPLPVSQDLDLVVKYQSADVSDNAKTFQENMAVMRALVSKFPEFRQAFDGLVARAVDPSGKDYGSLLAMKDVR